MRQQGQKKKAGEESTLVSRNITVLGRRTSVRLEPEMWVALKEIAEREKCNIHDICSLIRMRKNPKTSFTAAIRVFLMLYFRAASTEEGHRRAGHGNFEYMLQRARIPGQGVPAFSNTKEIKRRQLYQDEFGSGKLNTKVREA